MTMNDNSLLDVIYTIIFHVNRIKYQDSPDHGLGLGFVAFIET